MAKGNKNRNKAAMRKNVNIKDIELSLLHQQKLLNYGLADKSDQELFSEVIPSNSIQPSTTILSNNERNTNDSSSRATAVAKRALGGRQSLLVKANKLYKLQQRAAADDKPEKNGIRTRVVADGKLRDPWVSDNSKAETPFLFKLPATSQVEDSFVQHLRRVTVKRPGHHVRPSSLAAVSIPHAGLSVNPVPETHAQLVEAMHANKKRADAYVAGKSPNSKKPLTRAEKIRKLKLEREKAALPESDLAETGFSESTAKPVVVNRKTTAERNRKLRNKTEERKLQQKKQARLMEQDVYNAKSIVKRLQAEERENETKQLLKVAKYVDPDRTRRLGRLQFIAKPETDAVSAKPVPGGSLRKVVQNGDLLRDRWLSMQQRNFVEPRKHVIAKRKYAKKGYLVRTNLIPELSAKYDAQQGLA